jgi:hypothetical protein
VGQPVPWSTWSRVRASTARAVAELYAELESTPGPSRRVAVTAPARGYLAPAWWDVDTIDDPDARPVGVREYERTAKSNKLLDVADAPRLAH